MVSLKAGSSLQILTDAQAANGAQKDHAMQKYRQPALSAPVDFGQEAFV